MQEHPIVQKAYFYTSIAVQLLIWISIFALIFYVSIPSVLGADGQNMTNQTGQSQSCPDAHPSSPCSKISDRNISTYMGNAVSGTQQSASILFDPSLINVYISNITIRAKVYAGSDTSTLRCLNASSGTYNTIGTIGLTTVEQEFILNNINRGCTKINLSTGGTPDWAVYEIMVFNGTNTSIPINTPINLTATATDLYDGTSLNFSLSIMRGSNVILNQTTNNGTILVANITNGMANLTFQSTQAGGYFEHNYLNVNLSGQSFIGQLYQAILYLNASQAVTGTQITNFGASAPLQYNQSNSSGWTKLFLKAGSYNITGNTTGYINSTVTLTLSAQSESISSFEFGTNRLRIDARSIIDNAYIQNFTILLYNGSYTKQVNTTTGNASFDLITGTWYMNFSSVTHANMNASIVVSSASMFPNYTFNVYTTNSINFTILDEQTGFKLVSLPVDIEIISETYSVNYTTNTSSFYVDLLDPESYLVRWSADGYVKRTYYFNLNNGSNNLIYLYMLNSSLSTQISQQVIDENGNPVVDAYVKVYRYFFPNNAYSIREIVKTNSNGIAGLNVILNDEFYYFNVERPLGGDLETTAPTYIYSSTVDAIQVNIGSSFAQKYFNTLNTQYNLSFNDVTNSFRFYWDDPNGLVSEGCLYIYKVQTSNDVLVNSSCDQSSSSTIILRVANESGVTYRAEAFFGFSPADNLISSLSKYFAAGNPIGASGLLFVIFLTMTVFLIAVWSLPIAVLIAPVPALFASLGGFIDVSATMVIPIQIAAIVVAYVISRR